jgi:hypothetical protein
LSGDDQYRALEQRAQRYRSYALNATRMAAEASPSIGAHYLALAEHWNRLAESVERQSERVRQPT